MLPRASHMVRVWQTWAAAQGHLSPPCSPCCPPLGPQLLWIPCAGLGIRKHDFPLALPSETSWHLFQPAGGPAHKQGGSELPSPGWGGS